MAKHLASLCLIAWLSCGGGQDQQSAPTDEPNQGGESGGTAVAGTRGDAGAMGRAGGRTGEGGKADASLPSIDASSGIDAEGDARAGSDTTAWVSSKDGAMDASSVVALFSSPCPAAPEACRIMPMGDSITDGVGSSVAGGGYRVSLFREAVKAGLNITFVGSGMNGPTTVEGKPFPRMHEGHSGSFIQGLQVAGAGFIKTYKPHIVLLMIGTNDANRAPADSLATAPARVGQLIDTLLQNSGPKTVVIVAQIVPTTDDANNARVRTFNAALPAVVAARVAAGKSVALVDMYSAFTAEPNFKKVYMSDGLHPSDAGYVIMTKVWWPVLKGLLK